MPRPLRIEYDGAWYHVMNRGANHQPIFHTDLHRRIFLSLLEDIAEKFHIETHAYCLMDNHYHLILHTPVGNLSKGMRHLDGLYTQKFNRLENRDGSLFRGRYKAILVEADTYLLELARYIHLNPVAALMCQFPHDFAWSSYNSYIGLRKKEKWLHTNIIFDFLNNSVERYIAFMQEGISDSISKFYGKTYISSILGSNDFIKEKLKQLTPDQLSFSSHDVKRMQTLFSPQQIIEKVTFYYQKDFHSLLSSTRGQFNAPKNICIYLLKQFSQLSHQKIAEYLGGTHMSIATSLRNFKKIIEKDMAIQSSIKNILALCGSNT